MLRFRYMPTTNKKQVGARRDKSNIKFIVIHYTGNPGKGANALAHYKNLNNQARYGSAHYFIDDKEIIQTIGDSFTAWSVEGRGYNNGKIGCWNHNSISLEMCINSDGDFDKTFFNTVELTKALKLLYPNAKVVRHWDANGKECPMMMVGRNNAMWNKFLAEIKKPRKLILDISKDSVAKKIDNTLKSTAVKKRWVQEDGKWYYYQDGKRKIGWLKSGTKWFYMQPDKGGEMCVGWLKYNNNWFYFNEKGYMLTGEQVIDGKSYKFNSEGYLK